jgi:hypothetical protein
MGKIPGPITTYKQARVQWQLVSLESPFHERHVGVQHKSNKSMKFRIMKINNKLFSFSEYSKQFVWRL